MSTTNNKAVKILQSLDKIEKVPAPDFFYTRLKARMERERSPEERPLLLFRPAFLTTCLVLALMINVFALLTKKSDHAESGPGIESFAKEYNLSSTGQLYE